MQTRSTLTEVDLAKRNFLKTGSTIALGSVVFGAGFTEPACDGPSKEKAVRVTGFVIDLAKEGVPLLNLLGVPEIAKLVSEKGIPALEKLQDVLADTNIPEAQSALTTVRNVLSGVATALLSLPESPRRTTVIGILASINVLLLTVEAFIGSEMLPQASPDTIPAVLKDADIRAAKTAKMLKVFEATKQ